MVMPIGMTMLFSCENDMAVVQAITNKESIPVESAKDVRMLYSTYARVEIEIKAPVMHNFQTANPYLEFPDGIQVWFYDSLKNVKSQLSARYAIQYINEDKIEVRNDVVVVNQQNQTINTELLIWDQKKAMIYSDKFVKITTEDEVLFGDGFESDETFDKWIILKPRGSFRVETE